jgi:small subunit ribosomal protein S17
MTEASSASPKTKTRTPRKTEVGMVTSDKMTKTRRVIIERLVPHPKYGKMMRLRTICHAHDEANTSHIGDVVEIMETRPLSKLKRWRIVKIVRLGAQRALAGEDEAART